ncbi:demethylspheroidene O-methyltransferase [Methylobacterium brachiatum]|uniref:Demethylspheroidene O-methyltransferase n=1 Tax=Methylobacterium brachiatum TaxID=269660 RepID=A0AAJ1WUY4_9HYPH|nr:acetylserotonin O-methyltransferase [Methylobacterium brachiatum]MCB4800550.1 acetylserotonin O-methyltransferase [Methylobacterium brachiatum]MDQ0541695.1 demethylspheroidene O-methyltransferase [Methylobacterium brachiatum]
MAAPASLRDRWLGWRNRLVASPRFQRWAAGFPLTRGIARKNTRALFDLCAGFVYAQVLTACIRLDLFRILSEGPLPLEVLARRLDLPLENARCLLRAAASLDLVRALPGDRFGLADLGAALTGNPGIAAMVEHHALLYADLADPVALLRGAAGPTRLAGYWPYASGAIGDAASVAPYGGLMGASQALIADDVLDACDLSRSRHLMDVGGGEGAFLQAVAARHAALGLTLFDLPAVADRAAERLAQIGLAERIACRGGSFHDGLPTGADTITLIRILHDHDDAPAQALLAAAHAALPPGGTLILAEPMAGTPGAEPVGDAYFGFYLLAMGSGRPRRAEELHEMLRQAGFTASKERPTRRPLLTRLIVTQKDAR